MKAFAILFSLLFAAYLHALPEPFFEHPGSREPMRETAIFYSDDYPALAQLVRRVRETKERTGGISGKTLSLWVNAPLKVGVAYPLVRISAMPGAGLWDDLSAYLLELLPEGNGHRLVFRKHKNWPTHPGSRCLSVPFPATPNRWVHVVLSIPTVESGNTYTDPCPVTLVVDGRAYPGVFWNDMKMERCGALSLGSPGVGIGPVQLFDASLGGDLTPEFLRRRTVRSVTPPVNFPMPTFRCTFDGSLQSHSPFGPIRFSRDSSTSSTDWVRTPNGQGATASYWAQRFFASGESFTLVAVGQVSPISGDVFICAGVGMCDSQGFWLETGREGKLLLRTSMPNRSEETLQVFLPDASTAFHCYVLRYDAGELSFWVDGRRVGALNIRATAELPDSRMPHITDSHRLAVRYIQFGKRLGYFPASRGSFVIDDLSFYGRALSEEELARLTKTFTLTGKAPTAAASAVPTKDISPTSTSTSISTSGTLSLPALPTGHRSPTVDELKAAEQLLGELFEEKQPNVTDLLTYLRDAASDPVRLALLRRLEATLLRERRFDDALYVMKGRAKAFKGSITEGEIAAWTKEALRATAVRTPEEALRYATTALAFAESQHLPKAAQEILNLTEQTARYLAKAKAYPTWRARVETVERQLAAEKVLEALRLKAKGGDPTANRTLADALAMAGQWGEETLGAYIAGDHPALAKLAGEEAVGDNSAKTALALGDGWWAQADACEKGTPALAEAFRRHAVIHYRKGLPAVSGLRARLLRKRIEAFQ